MKTKKNKNPDRPLLGFCPMGKFVFSHQDALHYKSLLEQKLKEWDIRYESIDEVVKDGMVRGTNDIVPVIDYLKSKKVKAVFMPHCNFGTEHAVGLIGRDLGVPVLVWGPRDEAPLEDGTRLRDTLCGLFASTKVLYKLKVPFTYIENCRLDSPQLKDGLDTFLRAVNVADCFRRGIRIGHIGQRINFFWTTIINESELLEQFRVEVLPIDMVEFIREVKERVNRDRERYKIEIRALRERYKIKGFDDWQPLINVLAVRDEMLKVVDDEGLDGIAFQDFNAIVDEMGAYCYLAHSMVSEVCPLGFESDIHGAIGNIMLSRANFSTEPVFLTEFTVRHPENDQAVLLWHAGAPLSMCHPDEKVEIGPHWILPLPQSGMPHFRLKDGLITVTRFDGESGDYQLALGSGRTIPGPKTLNNYLWMEVENWPLWEKTLMQGPFIHHVSMAYGKYSGALIEVCKYIPGLKPVPLSSDNC